jgi:hypothetical protein
VADFVDRALLRFADPAGLQTLIAPGPGVPLAPLQMLLGSTYDLSQVRIDQITGVTVTDIRLQVPLYPVDRHRGTWTRAQPAYLSTDVSIDTRSSTDPVWVDLLARIRLHTVTEVDPGGIEFALTRGLDDFTTLDEFRNQFRFFDLEDFMARHRLSTVEDLREAFEYLVSEIHLRKPGPFDPNDPANAHDVEFDLALLVRNDIDLAGLLRTAATVRAIADQTRVAPKDALLGMPESALAVAAILDETAVTGAGITTAAISQLLAREQVLSLVASPP